MGEEPLGLLPLIGQVLIGPSAQPEEAPTKPMGEAAQSGTDG